MKKAIALLLAGLLALSLAACRGGDVRGNTVGNIANQGLVSMAGNRIYYCNTGDGAKLYSMKPNGTDKQKLSDDIAEWINVVGDRVYYCNDTLALCSVKTDGSDPQRLGVSKCSHMTVVGDTIYYSDDKTYSYNYKVGTINSIKTDGTNQKQLSDDLTESFCVAGDRIYYNNVDDGLKLYSMKTDGSDKKS